MKTKKIMKPKNILKFSKEFINRTKNNTKNIK